MPVAHVEFRSDSWNGAADGIIKSLQQANVRIGQIISIDAHNNGPNEKAIFSTHYDTDLPDRGRLIQLKYHVQNDSYSWDEFYKRAAAEASKCKPVDVISITGACNEGGKAVMYVFYYYQTSCEQPQMINYVEARHDHWEGAANSIIQKLKDSGVRAGQVISIDAHNNDINQVAIFSAHWNASIPSKGSLKVDWEKVNSADAWVYHYNFASSKLTTHKYLPISITSSINTTNTAVTYLFH